MRGSDHQRKLFEKFMGEHLKWYGPAETRRLYDCYLTGWEDSEDRPVRLQLMPNQEVPTRYLEQLGDNYYRDIGKPDWEVQIERVEWSAIDSMVFIYYKTLVDPDC